MSSVASPARAGYTETLPPRTFLLDSAWISSRVSASYDDAGDRTSLIPGIERYEPGGGKQGTIVVDAAAGYTVLLNQLQIGLLEGLSLGLGLPVVLSNWIDPKLGWIPGDYSQSLGRAYTEEDFWAWAASMGQPRPGAWRGGLSLADSVVGLRWRWSDRWSALRRLGLASTLSAMGALPTGSPPDPEEVVGAGSTMWDLHTQGELAVHLAFDKTFPRFLDNRVVVGLDLYYEAFLPHTYRTARGDRNPLLLTHAPYAGDTYVLDPGDFWGAELLLDVVAWRGPARASWISGGSAERAAAFPPLVTATLRWNHQRLNQSDWQSSSALWDWEREKNWMPGFKNIVTANVSVSLLRLGVPLMLHGRVRTMSLIPGRNSRAVDAVSAGISVPMKF